MTYPIAPEFKTGDLLRRQGLGETYCIYNENDMSCIIHSDPNTGNVEGSEFFINPFLWKLMYREGEEPDALYVPEHDLEPEPCSCDLVSIMQVGCQCGGV